MNLTEISKFRLSNQQLAETHFCSAKELVSWMGAMQAQDYSMAKWALGLRLQNATAESIEWSYNQGEILRTHLMRPTWHFVSSDDIYWMLDLTSPQIRPLLKSRDKQLELSAEVYSKSNLIIESALSNSIFLTREEIGYELKRSQIEINNNRLSHLLLRAELDEVVCSGPVKGNKLTYCLLAERVPEKKTFTRDVALAELATRYFTSHGPATLKDFVWWSGLSVTDARMALGDVKSNFISETIGSETFWFKYSDSNLLSDDISVFLLPAYDEFMIAYKDRSASCIFTDNKKVISENGIFRPIALIDGQVNGLWTRTIKKNKVLIEIDFFRPQAQSVLSAFEKAARAYECFLGKEVVITVNNEAEIN